MFSAFVSWPSAPLTNSLVRKALGRLDPRPDIVQTCPDGLRLQWSTYDMQDHEKTLANPDSVLASTYTMRKALIRKHFLHRCIHTYVTKYPDSVLVRHVPRTWDLEISSADELDEMWADDLWDLGAELDRQPRKWWILKPGMADRGMGIRLFNSRDALQAVFESFEDTDTSEDEYDMSGCSTGVVTSQLRHFVNQEYLTGPLLLDPRESSKAVSEPPEGHKFHLRAYSVARGDLKVYLFRHALALFSSKPYEIPESVNGEEPDLAPHLTNTCLQAEHDERYVRLLDELVGCKVYPDTGEEYGTVTIYDVDNVFEQMSDILAEVFRAAVQMPVHFQPLPNAFELYGVDFLVTRKCSTKPSGCGRFLVSLLEVNSEPAIEMTGKRLQWILEELFMDIGRTFVEPFFQVRKLPGEVDEGGNEQSFRLCLNLDVRGRQDSSLT